MLIVSNILSESSTQKERIGDSFMTNIKSGIFGNKIKIKLRCCSKRYYHVLPKQRIIRYFQIRLSDIGKNIPSKFR